LLGKENKEKRNGRRGKWQLSKSTDHKPKPIEWKEFLVIWLWPMSSFLHARSMNSMLSCYGTEREREILNAVSLWKLPMGTYH